MVHPLIGIHAALGELGILAFLWVFVEMLNPTTNRVQRASLAATIGAILLLASWAAGGYYYVVHYGPAVKPVIKEGPTPWAHSIFMETKEHVFLLLPFVALLTAVLLRKVKENPAQSKDLRTAILLLTALIIIIGLSMAAMGYVISTGARAALEAKLL